MWSMQIDLDRPSAGDHFAREDGRLLRIGQASYEVIAPVDHEPAKYGSIGTASKSRYMLVGDK